MSIGLGFDNHDSRIKYYELLLERPLRDLPHYPLPEGLRFAFYQPGDRDDWIRLEISAKEFETFDQGAAAWERFFGGHEAELPQRMLFVETREGEKVATATAYYDVIHGDPSGAGWLHWVAVRRDWQGRGLSKPVTARALERLEELGYQKAKVPTQTTSWLAVKVYLDLGFRPLAKNLEHSREGWRIVKALTEHPALAELDAASMEEILADPLKRPGGRP